MHYVYVIESASDHKFYIGCTVDLERRIQEHNTGKNVSTKLKGPFQLVYYEAFLVKKDAYTREKILKGQWGRKFLHRVLKNYLQQR